MSTTVEPPQCPVDLAPGESRYICHETGNTCLIVMLSPLYMCQLVRFCYLSHPLDTHAYVSSEDRCQILGIRLYLRHYFLKILAKALVSGSLELSFFDNTIRTKISCADSYTCTPPKNKLNVNI